MDMSAGRYSPSASTFVNQPENNRSKIKYMTITQWCQLLQISTKSKIYNLWTLTYPVSAWNSWAILCSSLIFVHEKSFAVRHTSGSLARLLTCCLNSSLFISYWKPMEITTRENNKSSVKSEISDRGHLTQERFWQSGTLWSFSVATHRGSQGIQI